MITMTIEGERTIIRNLEDLPRRLTRDNLLRVARVGAEPIRARASALAPHAPGKPDLRDNIIIEDLKPGTSLVARAQVGVAIGPNLQGFYGFFQEVGTRHHSAQPFMRPAFDIEWAKSMDLMRVELWATIQVGVR